MPIGKGKNVEETQDKYRDEFDLIDQDNPQEEVDEEEFNSLGYQKELRRRENSEKGDSAVTTGTEGTNNPVMAGKKVVKVRSQEQAEEDRKAAKIAQAEEDKKEAEKPKGDTDEYPAWHDKDPFY